jgi:Fe-S cluster assembly ATP-binding protein
VSVLEIRGLRAAVAGKEILHGIDLTVTSGEVHAVMGPNGAGKTTLSAVVMGRPGYEVLDGSVTLDGVDVLAMAPWQRAAAGLFLVMQYPTEVPGVALDGMLREAISARGHVREDDLDGLLRREADRIGLEERLLHRPLNVDLSGGEKKRNETLQLAVLRPRIAILDELDSGLDIDALRACARRIEAETEPSDDGPGLGVLAITHYNRLLTVLRADRVHILVRGAIVASGGPEFADRLEAEGYTAFTGEPDEDDGLERPQIRPGSLDELFASG